MDRTRIFLAANVLLWLPYGLYCLAAPGFLAETAGVAATTPTGSTELRAMYGGLQATIGALSLAACLRRDLQRAARASTVKHSRAQGTSTSLPAG